jgi:hypothetical protein
MPAALVQLVFAFPASTPPASASRPSPSRASASWPFARRLFELCLLVLVGVGGGGCAPTPRVVEPPVLLPSAALVDVDGVVARLSTYVRAWNTARAGVRAVVVDDLGVAGIDVVEGGRGLRAGSSSATLALVVRLADIDACPTVDRDAGVVAGEPPRVVGCGAQRLAGLALFATAVAALRDAPVALIVGEDDDDIDALVPETARAVWLVDGEFAAGVDVDVLDVVVVDPGWLHVSLRTAAADVDALLRAAARVTSWSPAPRLPAVVADRLAMLPPAGPLPLVRANAATLAADPKRRALVVDGCSLVEFPTPRDVVRDDAPARLRCRALPGRPLERVVDDVIAATDDPRVLVDVAVAAAATATAMTSPVASALARRVRAASPRTVVAPALSTSALPSACGPLRRRGQACVGALPVLTHPERIARRGARDEAVDTAALVRGARIVVEVVLDVVAGLPM